MKFKMRNANIQIDRNAEIEKMFYWMQEVERL